MLNVLFLFVGTHIISLYLFFKATNIIIIIYKTSLIKVLLVYIFIIEMKKLWWYCFIIDLLIWLFFCNLSFCRWISYQRRSIHSLGVPSHTLLDRCWIPGMIFGLLTKGLIRKVNQLQFSASIWIQGNQNQYPFLK